MGIFRKYMTVEELAPELLVEKEMTTVHKTFITYIHHIKVFVDWQKENDVNVPIRKITKEQMRDYFQYLANEKHLDRDTIDKFYMHIKAVFKYAIKKGEATTIPFDLVAFPRKVKDQSADVIQPDHLRTLLIEIKEKDPQLFLACMIQFYCFIRPGRELRFLKVNDIYLDDGLIKINQFNAKNHKEQIVTMPQQLIDICYEYGIDKADKNLYIFGPKGKYATKPVSENMLRFRFNKFKKALNLPNGYKFYSFKHTGASMLHKSGISMRELMDQLRHTRLSATEHYLKKHTGIINDRIRYNFPDPLKEAI
jgi:integrase